MQRKIFEPKRDLVTAACKRLHNEEPDDLYCWPNIIQIKKNKMEGALGTYGVEERCIQALVGRPEVKETLAKHKRKWDYNIKM